MQTDPDLLNGPAPVSESLKALYINFRVIENIC